MARSHPLANTGEHRQKLIPCVLAWVAPETHDKVADLEDVEKGAPLLAASPGAGEAAFSHIGRFMRIIHHERQDRIWRVGQGGLVADNTAFKFGMRLGNLHHAAKEKRLAHPLRTNHEDYLTAHISEDLLELR